MKTNVNSARADFLSKYKANLNEIKKCDKVINFNEYYIDPKDRLSRDEVRDVVTEMSRDMERKERTKRPNSKKRKLRHNKNSRENKKINKKQYRGNIKKKVLAIFLTGIAIAGGYSIKTAYDEYISQNTPASIENIIDKDKGTNMEALGINSDLLLRLQELQKNVDIDNVTNQELINLAPQINELQVDVIKTKLGNLLQEPASNISIYRDYSGEGRFEEFVMVKDKLLNNKERYRSKDMFTYKNTITSEISNYIVDIDEMQSLMIRLQDGDFNREEVIKQYKEVLRNTSQFAGMKLTIDEKGNISADVTKVKDLYNNTDQIKTDRVDQNIDEER